MDQPDVLPATVVIFDTSGSMRHPFQGANSKLEFARSVLDRQLPILVQQRKPFGLKQFNGRGNVETVLTIGVHTEQELGVAFNRLRREPDGGSPLGQAMLEATRELAETPTVGRSIVALSDGEDIPQHYAARMPEAFAAMRRINGSFGARIKPFLIGVGELSEKEFASFNLEASELGGGLFPLEDAGDENVAREQARRVFDYAIASRHDSQLRQALALNEQLNANKLAIRRMLDQFEKRRAATFADVAKRVDQLDADQSRRYAEQQGFSHKLSAEIAALSNTIQQASDLRAKDSEALERFAKEIDALAKKTSTHRPFSTIFEWSVVAGLGGLLVLLIVTAIGLQSADTRIVKQFSGEIEMITNTVDKLWDIWGR